MNKYRTHNCGELNLTHNGKQIKLSASWLESHAYDKKQNISKVWINSSLKTWSKNATLANETFGESVDYLSVREVIKSLNYFYEDPLNSYIPIPSAIIIANLYGQRVPINIIEKYICMPPSRI